jgi:hypothetical protein
MLLVHDADRIISTRPLPVSTLGHFLLSSPLQTVHEARCSIKSLPLTARMRFASENMRCITIQRVTYHTPRNVTPAHSYPILSITLAIL